MLPKLTACLLLTIIIFFIRMIDSWSGYIHHYEIEYVNLSSVNISAFIKKLNRTTYAGNIFFDIIEDFPLDQEVEIKIYGEYSNKYKELPIHISRSICDMISMEYQMVKNEVVGQIPEKCPIKKGHYYCTDFILNLRNIPKNPWSNIRHFKVPMKFFNRRLKTMSVILSAFIETTVDDEYRN